MGPGDDLHPAAKNKYEILPGTADSLEKYSITPSHLNLRYYRSDSKYDGPVWFSGDSTDNGLSYHGHVQDNIHDFGIQTIYRKQNPFYFTAYKLNKNIQ